MRFCFLDASDEVNRNLFQMVIFYVLQFNVEGFIYVSYLHAGISCPPTSSAVPLFYPASLTQPLDALVG